MRVVQVIGLWMAGMACWLGTAHAQWVTQSIPLQAGWNAVHVEVKPFDGDFDTLFDGVPVEGVWQWNKQFNTTEFMLDPEHLLVPGPHWLVWLPEREEASFLSQITGFRAGQSYLVRMAADAAPVTLALKGTPVIPNLAWFPNALNLVGF
ncbi:MAG: hypothetical protein LBN38_08875, partial [Verrucomicrobiota bacterium]|nr:hypothetical protein [Verrucomicrobiota bacterium]